MELPAPALRRLARLLRGDVHPHTSRPQGPAEEGSLNPLREIIEQEIREQGPIPFSRYMELCLYHPELGYYSRNTEQFGKAGDFYTSSDVHAVFGRLMARQFDEMWRALGSPDRVLVRELGPGRGLFAQDVLDWSEKKFPEFFHALRYELVEQSPALRQRIEQTLRHRLESGKARFANIHSANPDGASATALSTTGGSTSGASATGASTTGVSTTGKREPGKGTTLVVPNPGLAESALAAEGPVLLFANEFFDAVPVDIISSNGSLRIAANNGQ